MPALTWVNKIITWKILTWENFNLTWEDFNLTWENINLGNINLGKILTWINACFNLGQ